MNPKKFRAVLSAINILCASPLTSIILFPLTTLLPSFFRTFILILLLSALNV